MRSITASCILLFALGLVQGHGGPGARLDHDQKDYYVIRIETPPTFPEESAPLDLTTPPQWLTDQQQTLQDLLGLDFEARVGALSDYFLYSAPKRAQTVEAQGHPHSYSLWKRSLVSGPINQDQSFTSAVVLSDPVVERFHQLKRSFSAQSGSSGKRKRDLQGQVVRALGGIEKQELRQRYKKRAPVSHPRLRVVEGGDDELEQDVEQAIEEAEEEDVQEEEEAEAEEGEEDTGGEYQPKGEDQPLDGVADQFDIEDPGFRYQWHLHNTKDGHDINVTGVWEQGINGTGVNVAIIDDGLDMTSEDLAPNFFKEGSWDFNDHTALPMPRLTDDQHGTRCAGEIAAAKNDLCGVGVAYGAKVAGLRILSGQITDVDEAAALNYRFQENHIYSCSWGPPDDGKSMDAPKGVVLDAMVNGIKNGRGGLGSIYVFATGNGGSQDDDCNFDGYTNSLYTVSIGAIDREGRHPYYSEACSAQLAVTYSNGGGSAIYTCDVGQRRCFGNHGGTSAAAPIAAGMIALVLSVRPDLGWRDVQYLLMTTAIPISVNDPDWSRTAAGRLFNHKFGYGSLDAFALVETAKTFKRLGPQTSFHPAAVIVNHALVNGRRGVSSVLEVTDQDLKRQGVHLGTLEHITVTVNIAHERRGDVEVVLKSPHGVESLLGARRRWDTSRSGFVDWTFMTVKHWGEDPRGNWTLIVRDQGNPTYKGKFVDWRIKFWGEMEKNAVDLDSVMLSEDQGPTIPSADEKVLNESASDTSMPQGISNAAIKPSEAILEALSESKVIVGKDPSVNDAFENNPSEESTFNDKVVVNGPKGDEEEEQELASVAGRTLYIFGGILGSAALVVGYLTRHKWDGRGRYANVSGSTAMDRDMDPDLDMNLVPRRGWESQVRDPLHSSLQDDVDDRPSHITPLQNNRRQPAPRLARDLVQPLESPEEGQEDVFSSSFDVGSDTDEDDFLNENPRPSRLRPKQRQSPAILAVEDHSLGNS